MNGPGAPPLPPGAGSSPPGAAPGPPAAAPSPASPRGPGDAAAAGFSPERLHRIGAAFAERVASGRLPGAVWHVERRGVVAARAAVGRLDPGGDAPMREDAIFRIHSMTKPIVSVAALQLVEAGRLRLDLPVAHYLPEFASVRVLVDRDGDERLVAPPRPPSVHDLLRHTAGLTYEFHAPSAVRRRYRAADLNRASRSSAEQVAAIASLPLQHAPGAGFEYSRASDVLGRVVEVVAQASLGERLRRELLDPLGMRDTAFGVASSALARLAEPFAVDPDGGGPVALADPRAQRTLESGGGGLFSTLDDYARFLRMLLQGGTLDGVRLLGRKTVEWMTSDHLGALPVLDDALPPGHGFGLGFAVRLATGVAHVPGSPGTYGWGGSAGTVFFVDPHESMFALLLAQAPLQREEFQQLFRQLVYAALD